MTVADSDFEREIEHHYRHNVIVNILDATYYWFGASFITPRTILALYISHFTDNKLVLGLFLTIAAGGWFVPQLFTANWVQRMPRKKLGVVNVGLFTERVPVFLMVPAALLAVRAPTLSLVLFFAAFTWYIVGAGVIAVSWQDLVAKIIPLKQRGRFFGAANFGGTITGVLGATAAAWFLDRYEFPYSYALCFAAAAVLIFLSWVSLALTREPPLVSQEAPTSQREYWRSLPTILRTDRNFRAYLIFQAIINLAGMAGGFLAVYAVQRWQLPDSQAGYFTTTMLIGQSAANLLFGTLADRRGHKLVLELSALTSVLGIGLAILAPSPGWFHVIFALGGASTAGFMLAGIMIIFEFCSPDVRPTYIGLNNTIGGAMAAVAPLAHETRLRP